MAFSRNRSAYSPKPIDASHSAIPVMAHLWADKIAHWSGMRRHICSTEAPIAWILAQCNTVAQAKVDAVKRDVYYGDNF